MTRKPRPPIGDAPPRLRQRRRAGGDWRIWWEPRPSDRALGFDVVELDAARINWSVTEAKRLNKQLDTAHETGTRDAGLRKTGRLISDLIADYSRSVHFTENTAPATQTSYRKLMLQIDDKWGPQRVAAFDKATMAAWYQSLYREKSPRMAQALIRQVSILFEHAETLGWRPENSNPCLRLKIKTPAPRDRLATWPEIEAVIEAANTLGFAGLVLAIHLSLFQGQRQTDVIEATRGAFRLLDRNDPTTGQDRPEWTWTLLRSKNKRFAILPIHPDVLPLLRMALAQTGTANAPRTDDTALILDEATGKPYSVDLFAKRWAKARMLAARRVPSITTLKFRDLRSSFSRLARAAGASDDDTGDALGNSAATNPSLRQTYMPASFETSRRAILAVQRPQQVEKKEQAK